MSKEGKKRKYESGAAKRKKAKERKEKEEALNKIPKLSIFGFGTGSSSSSASATDTTPREAASFVEDSEANLQHEAENTGTLIIKEEPESDQNIDIDEGMELLVKPTEAARGAEYREDVGLWNENDINEEVRNYWVARGPANCQNHTCDFKKSEREYPGGFKRRFSTILLYRKHISGEKMIREWLVYSPSQGNIHCFVCKLFACRKSVFSGPGFCDWKHAYERLKEHENCESHRKALMAYILRNPFSRIDAELESQFIQEKEYWHNVLKRLVATIKFLTSRGLVLRGENDVLNSPQKGIYLGVLELIAQFDPFLSNHLAKYGHKGRGRSSYLSSTILEEIIEIMDKQLILEIVQEIKEAKYFSLSVDSTPDLTNTDQLTVIVRYVSKTDHKVEERFLKFLPIERHTGESLAGTVLEFFRENDINISNARGQSYDNASHMSGRYKAMRARIHQVNSLALYVPCAAHSLNLVAVCSVDSCLEATSFFSLVQQLFTFFSASTHHWRILCKCLGPSCVLKRFSDTRWSAHADAIKAFYNGYDKIRESLQNLATDVSKKAETRYEADAFQKQLMQLETVLLSDLWNRILEQFNSVSQALQREDIELGLAVSLLKSLHDYIISLRDDFVKIESAAKEKSVTQEYRDATKRKVSEKQQLDDENAEDTVQSGSEKFRVETYLPILDKLTATLAQRLEAYASLFELFGFLVEFKSMTTSKVDECCKVLQKMYAKDLESDFPQEFKHFCLLLDSNEKVSDSDISASNMHAFIFENHLESSFPNVEVALRMYLCLMVTNATGERSFSKLKLIKGVKRSTMMEDRLNNLCLVSIENDLLQRIPFESILKCFIEKNYTQY